MRNATLLGAVAVTVPVLLIAPTAAARAQSVASGLEVLAAGQARGLSRDVTDKVIVVLKDQVRGLPDTVSNSARRAADVRSLQRGVLSQLDATQARHVRSFSLVNAVAATVSPAEAKRLVTNPAVAEVVPDGPVAYIPGPRVATRSPAAAAQRPLPGACSRRGRVQLNPQAIESIHAATQTGRGPAAQNLGYTGAGVKVAWIADGIDINNPDFIRANGQHVFVDYKDFSGTGTNAPTGGSEAFLDASSIAAQGRLTYNVADYGSGLSRPCLIRVLGVAPGASLVGLNVFGSSEFAFASGILDAINYAVTVDHVNILSESFTANPFPDDGPLDVVKMVNDAAIRAGVTVTTGAGDAGPTNTIGSPASDPKLINAGASTTYRIYAQTGFGGVTTRGVRGWINNNVSALSSAGSTQDGRTVDIVAPGDANWALCTADLAKYADCDTFAGTASPVEFEYGTSEAAPLTAGVAALVIQSYAGTHHGRRPSPATVKRIIVSTAQDIGAPGDQQGAGLLNAYQAVLAAASYRGRTRPPAGHAVLQSPGQLNAVARRGTTEHFAETLTNGGARRVTVGLSSRTLSPYRNALSRSLSLSKARDFEKTIRFTVPRGQARLSVSVALKGPVFISLITPGGRLAEYNLPQGTGNFGNAQVAHPVPGRWRAVVATTSSRTAVTARFQASTATWHRFGRLSATSVTLAPGASRTFTLTVATPAQPGDQAGSIILRSSARQPAFAAVTSVPVTLRSLLPAPSPSTTVTGTLTGGNGRNTSTGQTAYYQVDVPRGLGALNVQVRTRSASNTLLAELIDPVTGQAVSTAANSIPGPVKNGTGLVAQTGAQLHVLHPAGGRWTLVVDFFNQVSGNAVAQPFRVGINDRPVPASARGLPDSTSTKLTAGTPVTVGLRVTNRGSTPEAYFVDARLRTAATTRLAAQNTSTLKLPNVAGIIPTYLVPSHATAIRAAVTAVVPVLFDFSWAFGDPDLISSEGRKAVGTFAAPQIATGDWNITPLLPGPFGAKPARTRTATTSMAATAAAFDPAFSSPTGDLWLRSIHPASHFRPRIAKPGQTITIPVTLTPAGSPGSIVTGTIYIDDSSLIPAAATFDDLPFDVPEGSDVARFSYAYRIK
jgi:Subtilase family/Peptidase inhibitor I9